MLTGIIDSGQKIITNGLVMHLDAAQLRSYPGSGTTWTDLSGNGNNGTLVNGAAYNSANGGNIAFDGVNDYAQVANAASLNGTIQTVSIWFKMLSSTGVGNGAPLISKNGGTSSNNGYTFILYGNGQIQLQIKSTTQSTGPFIGDQYSFNVWRNIVFSFSSGVSYAIYDNSVLKSSGSCISFTIATQPLRLIDSLDAFWGILNANVGIVKLYNRLLSQDEITHNFNALKSRYGL